ncbi:MAG: cupin domain-containing protein [Candidatus Rokuibacteriota bacterium]
MKRLAPALLVALLGGADHGAAQAKVDARGISATVRLDEIVSGHLAGLNGKFRLRATEVTFAPDAHLGVHHHVGPGIRYVLSGKLTFTQAGKATIYQAGDYFFESGNVAHTAENRTKQPLRVIFFEIIPAEWAGATVIPPKAY